MSRASTATSLVPEPALGDTTASNPDAPASVRIRHRAAPKSAVASATPSRLPTPHQLSAPIIRFPLPAPRGHDATLRSTFLRSRWLLWGADVTIAAIGLGAAWLLQRPVLVLVALLWLTFMTIRSTRDGRMADLFDLRRVASANVCFVFFLTLMALLALDDLYGTRATLVIGTAMGALGVGARWCLGRPALRRWFNLRVDETVLVVGDLESVTRTVAEWEGVEELSIVGVCLSESDHRPRSVNGIPVLGTVADVADVSRRVGVDIVAVHDVDKLGGLQLARLQWTLEDIGAQLSIITPVTNTVEARATVRRAGRRMLVDVAHRRPRGRSPRSRARSTASWLPCFSS